ncbi:Cell division cycle protein 20-like [Gracilariopsis chorda]|uniref:Cell division cycle protein 20-like n=1 Tax=Gracilariopsis chorda TaxID=448386 RepID=A0A2V3J1I0_9FLOR|nr:Cell division cycle protein 20-like [Gracilariopsis chorda]|eukprot:PXF48173.1 Cell division cycle protein 20-like [Gracilariopsis chorda]
MNDFEDFSNFCAPVSSGPLPRWQRKALESSQHVNRPSSASVTPGRSKSKTPKSAKRSKTPSGDRFIPNRKAMNMDVCRMHLTFESGKENGQRPSTTTDPVSSPSSTEKHANRYKQNASSEYSAVLASSLLDIPPSASSDFMRNDLPNSKILAFGDKAPAAKEGYLNPHRVLYNQNSFGSRVRRNKFRHIPQAPEKILDAPGLLEDFYLNLVDWGSNNTLAVALAESVYLWNADTGRIEQLCETPADDCITSVSWIPEGNYLAVGTNSTVVQIWDVEKMACTRRMRSHSGRVGALAWNGPLLSSGSRDSQIHNHDVRIPNHHVATLAAHTQEICGLKWSPNGTQLASGGNDNLVCVWDSTNAGSRWTPKFRFDQHNAAVKALAWCPWQNNLLATGGGTADRTLRFWSTASGACVNSIDTKSQVCSIVWSPHDKELVTSHGFSQNQLTVWKYPSLARMAELKGHTSRVLHTAISPDCQTVVSAAADETLRFWKVFAGNDSGRSGSKSGHFGKSDLSSSRSLTRSVNIR